MAHISKLQADVKKADANYKAAGKAYDDAPRFARDDACDAQVAAWFALVDARKALKAARSIKAATI
jgi:hypothetical protein